MDIQKWINQNKKGVKFTQSSINAAQSSIAANEKIFLVEKAYIYEPTAFGDYIEGIVVVTKKKVVFVYKKLFSDKVQTIDLNNVTLDFRAKPVSLSWLEIRNFPASLVIYSSKEILMKVQAAIGEAQNSTSAKTSATNNIVQVSKPSQSLKKQLKDLKELLDEGIITQEEYDAKKKKILGL